MRFVLQFTDGQEFPHALGKVVCIGRNYADHAKELDNPVPTEPLLFIKPSTSVVDLTKPLDPPFSRGDVHYEVELALLVGETLTHATMDEAERQHGEGADMIFAIPSLVAEMSRHFTLEPGDVILTGTPSGVGKLVRGSSLRLTLTGGLKIETSVVE